MLTRQCFFLIFWMRFSKFFKSITSCDVIYFGTSSAFSPRWDKQSHTTHTFSRVNSFLESIESGEHMCSMNPQWGLGEHFFFEFIKHVREYKYIIPCIGCWVKIIT